MPYDFIISLLVRMCSALTNSIDLHVLYTDASFEFVCDVLIRIGTRLPVWHTTVKRPTYFVFQHGNCTAKFFKIETNKKVKLETRRASKMKCYREWLEVWEMPEEYNNNNKYYERSSGNNNKNYRWTSIPMQCTHISHKQKDGCVIKVFGISTTNETLSNDSKQSVVGWLSLVMLVLVLSPLLSKFIFCVMQIPFHNNESFICRILESCLHQRNSPKVVFILPISLFRLFVELKLHVMHDISQISNISDSNQLRMGTTFVFSVCFFGVLCRLLYYILI